jgi:predicted 2-oxoglutarate/Fe(II)-dependent dioxygenase YbiX/peroxiredoxin
MLQPGDPAPYFSAPSSVNPNFHFDTIAGRYVVLCFFASTRIRFSARLLEEVDRHRDRFNVTDVAFFGVTCDPVDGGRLTQGPPGIVYFFDNDLSIGRKFGVVTDHTKGNSADAGPERGERKRYGYQPQTFVLDQALRVVAAVDFAGKPTDHLDDVLRVVDAMPKLETLGTPAPVLTVPHVFEPELCRRLISYYEEHGGKDSGFMRDVGGKTTEIHDYSHKRRADCDVSDEGLIRETQERLLRRVVPAIRQAFQFNATRIERHIVACYASAEGGHFRAHRDNTTHGTAHRRFAVTINLNAEEFEGGELWFPEFSRRKYKSTTGGAVVFSCSLLHEATPVTKGRRFTFLPFLYDDAAAQVRERNRRHLAGADAFGATASPMAAHQA